MKIRDKLHLAVSFYILLAVMGGFFTYNELRTITKGLKFVETADDITNALLEVRRYEKNLLLYKDKSSMGELKNYLEIFKKHILSIKGEMVKELGEANYEMILAATAEYEQHINRIGENFKQQDSIDVVRSDARQIESFIDAFSKQERADINRRLQLSSRLLIFVILIVVVLGAIINIRLAKSIAEPIKKLEEVTKKIAAGDFSEKIKIRGRDELASLSASVNIMEDKLRDTMGAFKLAITRLNEKQAQLVETEKLATLGKFSAGVAHEINNPIAIINEKAGLMKDILEISEDFGNKEKFLGLISAILDSINRCKTITHRILGFARKSDIAFEAFNINSTVKEASEFMEKEMFYRSIRLEINLQENMPPVKSDRGQLQQVFLNLIKNAIDAVEEGGVITISTDLKDKDTVRIAIKDTGCGIPPENLNRIFEPFFTTKERKKGTGLGLSITYGIINNLGGNIYVDSEAGQGTAFTIELPVHGKPAEWKTA
ncbi:MAG: HAMP domain-containing protein [Nitrospirae bacterium]|nr:HAMP domain-containing protein [Nitrospirota bacterium]